MPEDKQPTISTERLTLRPFTQADGPEVRRQAGNKAVAATTLNIPYPYDEGVAEAWIETHKENFQSRKAAIFAVTLRETSNLIGAIGIVFKEHDRGEMGYWIGQPHWNQGYATEAALALIDYGFSGLLLNKITASHLARNPASGRVMEKAGMNYEGCSPQHVEKWGRYEDLQFYGILKDDYPEKPHEDSS
ncbi:MAG TPA: GNAT family N-acetyltransferase [candidate division Zixibacteria bacterium]|nr:GNAT family N-acetyltransferase [candidate division Zixibacteria bacterium]